MSDKHHTRKYVRHILILCIIIVCEYAITQQTLGSDHSVNISLIQSEDQSTWIRNHSIVFNTAEPDWDYDDLLPLKEIIGSSRIVALGEGTHGTSEFFKMKHRITKFLVEVMDFSIFAIEANMPEVQRVNQYVLTGRGNPKKALSGMYFWTVNTQEVLDMIESMKEINISKNSHIEFWGFDLQVPNLAIKNVRDFVINADSNYLDQLSQAYDKVYGSQDSLKKKPIEKSALYLKWYQAATLVLDHLQSNRSRYIKKFEPTEVDWAIQNARIVVQGAESHIPGKHSRDESMVENVNWILAQKPQETKIILSAHNGHVTKSGGFFGDSMGKQLKNQYGSDIIVFGFTFHEGKYAARGGSGFKLGIFEAPPSKPGSVEWAFHQTGEPRLILDLRQVSNESSDSNWMNEILDFRAVGATVPYPTEFFPKIITDEFDVLIYFDQTNPSTLLK